MRYNEQVTGEHGLTSLTSGWSDSSDVSWVGYAASCFAVCLVRGLRALGKEVRMTKGYVQVRRAVRFALPTLVVGGLAYLFEVAFLESWSGRAHQLPVPA